MINTVCKITLYHCLDYFVVNHFIYKYKERQLCISNLDSLTLKPYM